MFLVPSLRNKERGIFHFPFYFKRHDNLFCRRMEAVANLRNSDKQQFLVGFLQLSFVFVGETLVNRAVFDMNIVDVGIVPVVVIDDGKYIDIRYRLTNHLAF